MNQSKLNIFGRLVYNDGYILSILNTIVVFAKGESGEVGKFIFY